MAQQKTAASEPSSPSEAECKVQTFYSVGDVSEEVDSHFAKALSMAAAKEASPCCSNPSSPSPPTSEANPHDTDVSSEPSSPTSSSVTHSPPTIASMTSTSPETGQAAGSIPALQHPPPLTFHTAGPDSPKQWSFFGPARPNKARIIYPEFAKFLVHPEVDSFKDLPKLPGQSDSPPPCPLHWQAAWSTNVTGIGKWPESTSKDLEQLSSQNRSISTKGYHSERSSPHQLGSNTRDTASNIAGSILGGHKRLYHPPTSSQYQPGPPLLPLQSVDPQCHHEMRHGRPSHVQTPYARNSPSATTEHLQLEFTSDELKEILELREHDI